MNYAAQKPIVIQATLVRLTICKSCKASVIIVNVYVQALLQWECGPRPERAGDVLRRATSVSFRGAAAAQVESACRLAHQSASPSQVQMLLC